MRFTQRLKDLFRRKKNVEEFQLPEYSFWAGAPKTWDFFCPHCKMQRKLPFRPRPGSISHLAKVGIATAFLMLLSWSWLRWKGILWFLPLWTGFEIFYRTRVRAAVVCYNCGFDPFLFLSDSQRAKDEIEKFWKKKLLEKGIPYPNRDAERPESGSDAVSQVKEPLPKRT